MSQAKDKKELRTHPIHIIKSKHKHEFMMTCIHCGGMQKNETARVELSRNSLNNTKGENHVKL